MKNPRLIAAAAFICLAVLYFAVQGAGVAAEAICITLPELLLLAALVLFPDPSVDKVVRTRVLAALAFSIGGDISGSLKPVFGDPAFLGQIALFSVAQVMYALSFVRMIRISPRITAAGWRWRIPFLVMMAIYFVTVGILVLSAIDSTVLLIACSVYFVLLIFTGSTSILQTRKFHPAFIAGASIFILSDSMIAIHAFVHPVPHRAVLVMVTYFLAQLLLNLTLVRDKAQ